MAQLIRKPNYIDPAGDPRHGALPIAPPFVFRAVTAHVFPLKANMARLSGFCDQYLNIAPPQIAQFRPSLPYVYLMVLNYGSMSAASVQAQNVGWVAQHEVTFTVPLERWREENGKLVFKDWACVSPFIFVDDQMSQTTGREVYGWPKVWARVDADVPLWANHPRASTRLFSLSTHVFPKVYAGERETLRVLLEIDREPSPAYSEVPPDPDNPWSPLSVWPNAARASLALMGDAVDMLTGLRIRGYRSNRDADSLIKMAAKGAGKLACLLPNLLAPLAGRRTEPTPSEGGTRVLSIEQITLKQFRDAEDPNNACYTALVSSPMGYDRLNHCGLLGDVSLLRGDPAAGYTVRIHRYTAQPIIESLGLELAAGQHESDDGSVAILKPTLPFWTDLDLYYGKGRVICSRTHGPGDEASDAWVDEQEQSAARTHPGPQRARAAGGEEQSHNLYNTALGAATQPVAGPFHFPDVTVQVYPLLADPSRLADFLDQYLNQPLQSSGLHFKPFGSYVYLMVNVCEDQLGTMWSSANNIGWWAEREVAFCVPVKWYHNDELVSLGMVAPFVYSSNGRAVISDREVNGRPSVAAIIESPKDVWLTQSGPVNERRLVHLKTEVFPALNLGQKAQQRTLLEIDERDVLPYNSDVGWRMVAETWGRELIDDLKRKTYLRSVKQQEVQDAKAMALEILAHEAPINWIILKQYRDAADTEKACYQAAVHTTRSVTRIYDIREIEQRVHVRLHRYPGYPIAHVLGLKIKSVDSTGGSVVENIQPVRPFWMRIAVKEELGTVVGLRATDGSWTMTHPWFAPAAARPEQADTAPYFRAPGATRVGSPLGRTRGLWHSLKDAGTEWLRRSLTNELAWIKVNVQRLQADERAALRGRLKPAARADFARLEAADSFAAFCDATSIERLLALARAVRQAGLRLEPPLELEDIHPTPARPLQHDPEDPAYDPRHPKHALRAVEEAGMKRELAVPRKQQDGSSDTAPLKETPEQVTLEQIQITLEQIIDTIDSHGTGRYRLEGTSWYQTGEKVLADERRAALEMTLPADMREALYALREKRKDPHFILPPSVKAHLSDNPLDATSMQYQRELLKALTLALLDWSQPSRWRRLAHDEAGKTIDALDEVQLVVESILSDEWENWGTYRKQPPKPEPCVPVNSVYGGATVLAGQRAAFAVEHGLSISKDGTWWYVETSKDPGKQ